MQSFFFIFLSSFFFFFCSILFHFLSFFFVLFFSVSWCRCSLFRVNKNLEEEKKKNSRTVSNYNQIKRNKMESARHKTLTAGQNWAIAWLCNHQLMMAPNRLFNLTGDANWSRLTPCRIQWTMTSGLLLSMASSMAKYGRITARADLLNQLKQRRWRRVNKLHIDPQLYKGRIQS